MAGRTYRRRFLLLGGVCLLLLLGSMLVGRYGLSVDKLLHMLWTRLTGGAADWSVSDEKVVFAIRLPRIAAAVLVGAALAVSGTAYQGMFRNPMVSPDILGASTGAGFGAAVLGVGRATQRVLDSYCIRTIGDLANNDPEFLRRRLGKKSAPIGAQSRSACW